MPYRVVLAVVVVVLSIQLVPVERTNPSPTGALTDVPAPVGDALRRACYDCHSRETRWPWYSRIAPASWLVSHDVTEGREELDFSTWTTLEPRQRAKLLGKVAEEVASEEMPPTLYLLLHPEARLDEAARSALVGWGRESAAVPGPAAGAPP